MSPNAKPEKPEKRAQRPQAEVSDLIGVKLTLWIAAWFMAILVAFFFVGPVTGIVVIIGGAVISILAVVKAIRGAELP